MSRYYIIRPDGSEAVVRWDEARVARSAGAKVWNERTLKSRLAVAERRFDDARAEFGWVTDGPKWTEFWVVDPVDYKKAASKMDRAEATMWRWAERLDAVRDSVGELTV